MVARHSPEANQGKVWTIAEAKAKLSEILRLAESEGPQRIGARKSFVVVTEDVWLNREESGHEEAQMPMGQWLLENLRGLGPLELPDRKETDLERPIPYADWTEAEWAAFDATDPGDPERK